MRARGQHAWPFMSTQYWKGHEPPPARRPAPEPVQSAPDVRDPGVLSQDPGLSFSGASWLRAQEMAEQELEAWRPKK